MDIEDMILDDDVPIEYLIPKINKKKASYVSPDANIINAHSFNKKSFYEFNPRNQQST